VSRRKAVVERYFDGFRRSDHEQILACLTEDVVWDIAGFKYLEGKDAYDQEIENENFVGSPTLDVNRLVEAIGTGESTKADVFQDELVCRRESYVVPRLTRA
jgi:ketosteroid isomerase-like protein